MEVWHALVLIGGGFVAGFVNAIAGGGSLITLPLLIFVGLPSAIANGTNRVSVIALTTSATLGYASKGVNPWPYNLWIGLAAIPGALIGAWLSVDISGELFNKILAGVMIVALVAILIDPIMKRKMGGEERMGVKQKAVTLFLFFLIGFYGGFIQAGIGFLMLASLSMVHRMDLAKANSIKMTVALIYTLAVLGFFIWQHKINWLYGMTLAVGTSTGAWIGSRWAVQRGKTWIRVILAVMVVLMAIKLFFFE